jgi:hypothetical protein
VAEENFSPGNLRYRLAFESFLSRVLILYFKKFNTFSYY